MVALPAAAQSPSGPPMSTVTRFAVALALLLSAAPVQRDRERAKDVLVPTRGRDIEGFLVRMDADRVHFRVGTRDQHFDREEVETVRSPLLLFGELAERFELSPLNDRASAKQLALWCQDVGLEQEALWAWWRLLMVDWNASEAHEALESKEGSRGWQVPLERRHYYREQFFERIANWNTAFELDLSLFKIRSSARPEDTFEAVGAMLRGFGLLYELFGELMELPYPREMVFVHLHGSAESYPPMNRRSAYFEGGENRIVADTSSWDGAATMVHELTHALLANAYMMIGDGKGSAPAWLTEGLAEHVAVALEARDQRVEDLEQTPRARQYLSIHAEAEEPLSLNRLLVAETDDFHDLSGANEYYAQAFTLILFLLEADEGAYRDRFGEFLRGTFEGKSSPTHLSGALGGDDRSLEDRWHEWVRSRVDR